MNTACTHQNQLIYHHSYQTSSVDIAKNNKNIRMGSIKINLKQFIECGGYPNDMWGIGYEDYVLIKRLEKVGHKFIDLIDHEGIYQFSDKNILYNSALSLST